MSLRSMRSAASQKFELAPSLGLRVYLLVLLVFSLVIVSAWLYSARFSALLTLLLSVIATLVLGLWFYRAWQQAAFQRPTALTALSYGDGHWQLFFASGLNQQWAWRGVRLWPLLLVLDMQSESGKRSHWVIYRDQLSATDWRRLRVFANSAALAKPGE